MCIKVGETVTSTLIRDIQYNYKYDAKQIWFVFRFFKYNTSHIKVTV